MSRLKKETYAVMDAIHWYKQKRKNADNCFVTCSGKTDGAGAQIQAVLSTMLFANELGIKYVHTPLKKISHPFYSKKNESSINNDNSYESKWENLINLGFNELTIDQINSNKLNVAQVSHPRQAKKRKNTLYVIPHCHKFADRNPNFYSKLLPKFQQKYAQSSEKPDLYFIPSKINVAIHIRRGEISKEDSKRYTNNHFVLNIIKKISTILNNSGTDPVFHIFSQGDTGEFLDIHLDSVIFHLKECPFTAFHHMVSADILVMAKSSFSYSAALFSKGAIIYLPFWHKPLQNWIAVNKNGGFNKKKLKNILEHII